jgi:dUTP pyrophosphatase
LAEEEEEMISMRFRRVRPEARVPEYMTAGAAGMDLAAAVDEPVVLGPGERAAVPTGLVVEIPVGYEGQVRPRSGLARRHGIAMVNAPGTIDSDYRGEVQVLLVNLGHEAYTVAPGDRIAQLVIAPVTRVALEEVKDGGALSATARGTGGFGHTG